MIEQKLLMYFKVEIFNAVGSKVKEIIVKAEGKTECHLEAVRWINSHLHNPSKCTYKIS